MRGGTKSKLSGLITIKIDYGKEESSSGDGGRFFFCGWMDVSEGKAGMEVRGRRVFCKGGAETEGV